MLSTAGAFVAAAFRVSAPLVAAALGGLVAELGGLISFGMEGFMLVGAFAAVAAAHAHGTAAGFVAAALAGTVLALLHGALVIGLGTDQVVTAVALNLFATGFTSYANTLLYGLATEPVRVTVPPGWIVYLAYPLVPAVWFLVQRTSWGLALRAVGEDPHAAHAAGISVRAHRFAALAVAGALAGLAGSMLSLVAVGQFAENISAGRGFIAYSAIVFGRWTPLGTAGGAMLFGLAEAIQLSLQALGVTLVPYQLLVALPYLVTLAVLVVFAGRASWPSASGLFFDPEER